MTWHSLFNLGTLESRHLLASLVVVFTLQGGYFAWTAWNWRVSRKARS